MNRSDTIYKRLKITSSIILMLSLVPLTIFFIKKNSEYLAPFMILIYFSFIMYSSSYVMFNANKRWVKDTTRYTLIFYPLIFVIIPFMLKNGNILILLLVGFIILMLTGIALMRLFLFEKPTSVMLTVILLSFVIISLLFKKYHLRYATLLMIFSISWFAIGIFIFGIRCLFLIENNKYFKRLSFFVTVLIMVTFIGILFKMNHWPVGGILITTSSSLMIIGSSVVLLSLPYAGYIDWPIIHKKILRKLLYPWIFIFLLFLFKQLTPGAWNTFWGASATVEKRMPGFEMVDYPVENKNGLE